MKRKEYLPELLCPAGNYEALLAAVEGGADAVYIGYKRFGARAFAENFDLDGVKRAALYCHLNGVKLYVTLNTLLSDTELLEAVDLAEQLASSGVDALIVSDLGLISEIRSRGIDIELHASTQLSVHNSTGADAAARLGCKRVVLARELSLENIKKTTELCAPETEVFLHGALCVSHSGQCLFSSLVGGRSGNRGECAQPCRLPYNNGKYPLSLKDLSLASHITSLIDSGVASLKIEGRMKSPDYVYTVTKIYRRLLDEGRNATDTEIATLAKAFSRGGFTDGYLRGSLEKMTGVRSDGDKALTKELGERVFRERLTEVVAECEIRLDKPSVLTLSLKNGKQRVTVTGDAAQIARSAPLTTEAVKVRLAKLGGTLFSLDTEDISLTLDEGVNLSPGSVNALRRAALEALSESFSPSVPLGDTRGTLEVLAKDVRREQPFESALFLLPKLYLELKAERLTDRFKTVFLPLFSLDGIKEEDMPNGVYLPPVITECEIPTVREALAKAKEKGIMYALVGNIGHIQLAQEAGLELFGDFRLNITNSFARHTAERLGIRTGLLSAELTLSELRRVGGGTVVYGRIPLMLTERCFIKDSFGCDKCGKAALTDRKGAKFPMIREWGHRNIILNSVVTYMGDRQGELSSNGVSVRHFIFSNEAPAEAAEAIRSYFSGSPLSTKELRRVGRRKI